MSEWFNDLGLVQWFTEQFTDTDAASLFRFVLIAWGVAAAAYIGLDRLGSVLLGRSRPLAQAPPTRARAWRWGRSEPPAEYSLLPPGVVDTTAAIPAPRPALTTGAAFERPTAVAAGMLAHTIAVPDPAGPLEDNEFWRMFDEESAPLFGYENGLRLRDGNAPERYNPVTRSVEPLKRHREAGILQWGWSPGATTIVEGDE